jgi:small subunit ribosomal protein S1
MALFDETQTHDTESETASSSADNNQPQSSEATSEAVTATPTSANENAPVAGQPQKEVIEDFATALETFSTDSESDVSDDRVIKGTVLKVTASHVLVDIGTKSEGAVPLDEVKDHEGNVKFQAGDDIDVMREKGVTDEGYVNLSHQKAQRLRAWDEIEKAYNDKVPIKARVIDRIKGGLNVDIMGARAFLPGSQVDVRPVRNLDGMKTQEFEVRIIKLNKKRGNIVVSRKQILDEEVAEKRGKTMEHLEEGSILTGAVKNLTDYGAFVDLGGIDVFLHITDM